jgi:hypothetical protein
MYPWWFWLQIIGYSLPVLTVIAIYYSFKTMYGYHEELYFDILTNCRKRPAPRRPMVIELRTSPPGFQITGDLRDLDLGKAETGKITVTLIDVDYSTHSARALLTL